MLSETRAYLATQRYQDLPGLKRNIDRWRYWMVHQLLRGMFLYQYQTSLLVGLNSATSLQ